MKFFSPTHIEEAVSLLAGNPGARCISGGATLVAMMNAELVEVPALVSLRKISRLRGISHDGQMLRIGAMTTHRAVARATELAAGWSGVRRAASQIAHPGVRTMGTIGGSISHADPAADYPAALVAADAIVEIAGPDGRRQVRAEDFFLDYYTTSLAEGELVTAVLLPPAPPGAVGVHRKLARTDGDFATASVSLVLALQGEICSHVRIAVGGCGATPVRVAAAEALLIGQPLSADRVHQAGELLAAACDPIDDVRGSAAYRLALVPRLLRQAINWAAAEATAGGA
ncbi:MAG: glyceraldehyde dehydrogenase subunit beta [Wenzhouxiangellaceae bacterium]